MTQPLTPTLESGPAALCFVCCPLQDELCGINEPLGAVLYAVGLSAGQVGAWGADALLKTDLCQAGDHLLHLC